MGWHGVKEVLEWPLKVSGIILSFITIAVGIKEFAFWFYSINLTLMIVFLVACVSLIGTVAIASTIVALRKPLILKKFRLPAFEEPKDVKPYNKHKIFVNKSGDCHSKEEKITVNLAEKRYIEMENLFTSHRPLTLQELNINTNAEVIKYEGLGTPYVKLFQRSKRQVDKYGLYFYRKGWIYSEWLERASVFDLSLQKIYERTDTTCIITSPK